MNQIDKERIRQLINIVQAAESTMSQVTMDRRGQWEKTQDLLLNAKKLLVPIANSLRSDTVEPTLSSVYVLTSRQLDGIEGIFSNEDAVLQFQWDLETLGAKELVVEEMPLMHSSTPGLTTGRE